MVIICPKCQLELRCTKNSVGVEQMSIDGPYQYFHADLWACPECGLEVISGFGIKPIIEHFNSDYARLVETERGLTSVFRAWVNQSERCQYQGASPVKTAS
jgi:hypothetical protein